MDITCPVCGNKLNAKADHCSFCGYTFKKYVETIQQEYYSVSKSYYHKIFDKIQELYKKLSTRSRNRLPFSFYDINRNFDAIIQVCLLLQLAEEEPMHKKEIDAIRDISEYCDCISFFNEKNHTTFTWDMLYRIKPGCAYKFISEFAKSLYPNFNIVASFFALGSCLSSGSNYYDEIKSDIAELSMSLMLATNSTCTAFGYAEESFEALVGSLCKNWINKAKNSL